MNGGYALGGGLLLTEPRHPGPTRSPLGGVGHAGIQLARMSQRCRAAMRSRLRHDDAGGHRTRPAEQPGAIYTGLISEGTAGPGCAGSPASTSRPRSRVLGGAGSPVRGRPSAFTGMRGRLCQASHGPHPARYSSSITLSRPLSSLTVRPFLRLRCRKRLKSASPLTPRALRLVLCGYIQVTDVAPGGLVQIQVGGQPGAQATRR